MCAIFVLFLSFSFIRPKPSRLFLHPSLLPQHNSKWMCVVVPSGLLCPNKPTAPLPFPVPPPAEAQKAPSWLSPLSPVQLTTAGTFGLLTSALLFLSFFHSLYPFLSLTPCRPPCQKSLLQLFLSLNIKKSHVCGIFSLWGSRSHSFPLSNTHL